MGRVVHDLLKTAFPAPLERIKAELLSANRWEGELVHTRMDGTKLMVASRWSLQRDQRGAPVAILETNNDITERKRAEETLRQSEAYLAESERLTHTGSWALDLASEKYLYVSKEDYRIWGFDPQEGLPTREAVFQRIHPEDRDEWKEKFENSLRKKEDSSDEYRIVLPVGAVKHIYTIRHAVLNNAGDLVRLVGTTADVTERKQAEEALRRTAAYLAETQRLTHTGTWVVDPTTKPLYWSEEEFRIWGFDPRGGLPTRDQVLQRIQPEDRDRFLQAFQRAIHDKVDADVEFRILSPDGTVKSVYGQGHPILNAHGELVELVGTTADITERKRADERLRQSEAYLAEAQKLTHTGSWARDSASGKYTHWSEEMFRIYEFDPLEGIPAEETVFRRIFPEDLPKAKGGLQKALREKVDTVDEYRVVLSDGAIKHIQVTRHPVLNEAGDLAKLVGTVVDITERKRAEQLQADLAHVNRVTTLGELAASIAHELKQPITATMTNARTSLRWLRRDQPEVQRASDALARIVHDGARAAEIIDRLRSLYKKTPPQRELVDVNAIIGEMVLLLRDEGHRHAVSIRMDLAADLPGIAADRVQLQQVLMNLMLNSIEAMKDTGGVLTVSSQPDDGRVLISVSDTGVGLPVEKANRIFDAFFTTKPQGSGMGLAISRSIVESHGGRLWAASNDGRGATFCFTLPTTTEVQQTLASGM